MINEVKKEMSVDTLLSDLDALEYEMECAASLAFCVGVAMEHNKDGTIDDKDSGNALYALHNHFADLSGKLEDLVHDARVEQWEASRAE